MTRKSTSSDLINDVHTHSLDVKNRYIYIHGHFGDHPEDTEPTIDYRVCNKFIKNMNILSATNEPIFVFLSSCGGSVEYGFSIFDLIKNSNSHIICIGHGFVASLSTILMQAADTRLIYPNTTFLVHDMSIAMEGKRLEVINDVNASKKLFEKILDIYIEKMKDGKKFQGKSLSQIRTFLVKRLRNTPEIYLSAEEALNWGLIDGIIGTTGYNDLESIKNGV